MKYALISVYDKTGIADFAKKLIAYGYKIISTGGTAKVLKNAGLDVTPIEKITHNPESFDGRMKTISFQIGGGILFDRTNQSHRKQAQELKIPSIDVVVCNLYPFEKTVSDFQVSLKTAIENIDIGGPTMIRSAAKNYQHVLVVTDPQDYEEVANALNNNDLLTPLRRKLSAKAFYLTSYYDSLIGRYFTAEEFPDTFTLPGKKIMDLRYGENPHQKASAYIQPIVTTPFAALTQVSGRQLSLTNLTDINAGLESVAIFKEPAAVIIKHNTPCGIALGPSQKIALERAIEADPESAFGGVIVLNKSLDIDSAKVIAQFREDRRGNIDIIASPKVVSDALALLARVRKTMGIYDFGNIPQKKTSHLNLKWIRGGFVLQVSDDDIEKGFKDWKTVTKKKPNQKQLEQMKIAWKFITRIRSNSVIVVDKSLPMTRGIGTGQTSRVRSTEIALEQAGKYVKNGILASDSFFPFDDSVALAGKFKIGAIVQQGGSINDQMVIDRANKLGIPMVFTNRRAFWH